MGKSKEIQAAKRAQQKKKPAKKKKWGAAGGGGGVETRYNAEAVVVFDEKTWRQVVAQVPKKRCITLPSVMTTFNCSRSLAKAALHRLTEEKLIMPVIKQSKVWIYAPYVEEEEEVVVVAADEEGEGEEVDVEVVAAEE